MTFWGPWIKHEDNLKPYVPRRDLKVRVKLRRDRGIDIHRYPRYAKDWFWSQSLGLDSIEYYSVEMRDFDKNIENYL